MCEALYSGVGNFRKSAVPQVGGHSRKLIRVPGGNIDEEMNLIIIILEAVDTFYNFHSNNYLLSGRYRNFGEHVFLGVIFS